MPSHPQQDPRASQSHSAPLLLATRADLRDGGVHSTVITGLRGGGVPTRGTSQLSRGEAGPALQRCFASGAEYRAGHRHPGLCTDGLLHTQTAPLLLLLLLWLKDRIAD